MFETTACILGINKFYLFALTTAAVIEGAVGQRWPFFITY